MKISQATFSGSSQSADGRPIPRLSEFAFIGRSNVGKSSLINMLCGAGKLAHTSSQPGKTRLINHFKINDSWYLVDLPGYGYAKISKKGREELSRIIYNYLNMSEELITLFVLLDSRLPLQKIDMDFINRLGDAGIPFSIIYTKSDKLGTQRLQAQIDENSQALREYWDELPPIFVTSAETGRGRDEVLNYIEAILGKL